MKKLAICILALILAIPTVALATPKYVECIPFADAQGNVTMPALPAGATLMDVILFDDVRGNTGPGGQSLGAVKSFELLVGQGFNFKWRDAQGNVWWQMITPQSGILLASRPGNRLSVDPWVNPKTGQVECKYIFKG